jgi:hypothetical protein
LGLAHLGNFFTNSSSGRPACFPTKSCKRHGNLARITSVGTIFVESIFATTIFAASAFVR